MTMNINVRGYVAIIVKRANGPDESYFGPNVVVNAGKQLMSERLAGVAVNAVTHIAVGESIQVADETDTTLIGTEHERLAGTLVVTANEFKISVTMGASIVFPVTIGEFGIFNNSVAGTMLARFVIPAISLADDDTIDVVWTIQFGD